jgi:hypothetical protein
MNERMNQAAVDELRVKTLEQFGDLNNKISNAELDTEYAREQAVDLLTDFLESLGEHDIVAAYNDLPTA